MKKITFIVTILLASGLSTGPVFAANDVTLTASANIVVGGKTVNLSGSNNVIQSLVVNQSNFSVTLATDAVITITSPTLNKLTSEGTGHVTSSVCDGTQSLLSLEYNGEGSVTNTITVSDTLCANSVAGGTSNGGGGGGGGSRPAPAVTTASKVLVTSPVSSAVLNFSRNLSVGYSGSDVKSLQVFLNSRGFAIAPSGVGSLGQETDVFGERTKQALIKFQAANKLPATGLFGPQTKALILSLGASVPTSTAVTTPTESAPSNSFSRNLSLGAKGDDVIKLQTMLNTLGFLKLAPTGYFGSVTETAVKEYQTSRGIPATGLVGTKTRAELTK